MGRLMARDGPRPQGAKITTVIIYLTVLLNVISTAIANPTLARLVRELNRHGVSVAVSAIALFLIVDFVQFLFAPLILGASDAVGRRPIIIFGITGLIGSNLLRAFSGDIIQLAAASVVLGMFSGVFGAALAAISDYTPPATRAARFGLMSSAVSAGYTIGPMLGGILGDLDVRAPFYAASIISISNLLLVLVIFRETLPCGLRKKFEVRKVSPVDTVRFYNQSANLRRLAVTYAALQSTMAFLPVLIPIYFMQAFGWSAGKVGLYIAVMSIISVAIQMILPGLLTARLGPAPTTAIALSVGALGFCFVGLSSSDTMLWIGALLMPVRNVATPTITAMMSAEVEQDGQGRLQGSNSSLFSISRMTAQLGLAILYGVSGATGAERGRACIAFLTAAGLMLIVTTIVWSLRRSHGPGRNSQSPRPSGA
jgi:DHA1 family tetracycline resistance protein-like MFS transporter